MNTALSHPLPRRDGLNKPYINYYLHITTMKVGINTDPMIQSNKIEQKMHMRPRVN